jgi:hypothetical protein
MKTSTIILVGVIAVGAYLLYTRNSTASTSSTSSSSSGFDLSGVLSDLTGSGSSLLGSLSGSFSGSTSGFGSDLDDLLGTDED